MPQRMKTILMLTCLDLIIKNKFNRHDSNLYWPISIKDTIQCFYFLTIMEHTANIINPNKGLIPSLLKVFAMFELRLIDLAGSPISTHSMLMQDCKSTSIRSGLLCRG